MLNRPKIVNLTIESYLLHVIYRLLGNARGFAILQITLRSLKFSLSLVTSENTVSKHLPYT